MKRYILFEIQAWYPSGGMDDVVFSSDSLEEIKEYLVGKEEDACVYYTVFDLDKRVSIDVGISY